jgi:redoxin
VTICVHVGKSNDNLENFLNEEKITLPVAVDAGETMKRYAVNGRPTYFLIDKDGKIAWWGLGRPPTDKQFEDLLKIATQSRF